MITKPGQAKPKKGHLVTTRRGNSGIPIEEWHSGVFFTAVECAEIAMAFAQAIEDNRDNPRLTKLPNAWRSKFKKWGAK